MSHISQQSDSDAAESSGTQHAPASKGIVAPALRKRSTFSAVANLSTIKEESSKSSCSSNSTASSTGSGHLHVHVGQECAGHSEVNPFSPNVVNMMLNALHCRAMDTTCTVSAALPQLVNGRCVTLGQFEFSNIGKVTSGGFASIFTCKQGKETKVLKVCVCHCVGVCMRVGVGYMCMGVCMGVVGVCGRCAHMYVRVCVFCVGVWKIERN